MTYMRCWSCKTRSTASPWVRVPGRIWSGYCAPPESWGVLLQLRWRRQPCAATGSAGHATARRSPTTTNVSNEFYRLLLGESMTYSCAVWSEETTDLQVAQEAKYELVCGKLGLRPGTRLLDVGCGWGGMVLHAARRHGVRAVGVTLSRAQAELARKRVAEAGLSEQIEIRLQDYRDVGDGPYDAISSIGMFEHVGAAQLPEYFRRLNGLLAPGGRLLNHGISQPAGRKPGGPNEFIDRYVFPDGELQQIGSVVTAVQSAGFEVRHLENLREHYALTLRAWVNNHQEHYDEAVLEVGEARARIWQLYLVGSAVNFERAQIEVYQTLAVRDDNGHSGMPLRPEWNSGEMATTADGDRPD